MNDEILKQISFEVERQLQLASIEKIVLNSEYHCLCYSGLATNVNSVMTPRFDMNILRGKNVLLKSIKCFAYADDPVIDFSFSDGTTETVPGNQRLTRMTDLYSNSLQLRIFYNGGLRNIFAEEIAGGTAYYPLDLNVDNIYYRFKDKVDEITINASGNVSDDFAGNVGEVLLVVMLELYTY